MRHFDPIILNDRDNAYKRLAQIFQERHWDFEIRGFREVPYGKRKVWKFVTPYEYLALTDTGQIVRAEEPDMLWEKEGV